jgi:hypothetical protein
MEPPPLPFDQFPLALRLVGRPALGELWRACFEAGYEAGLAKGLAFGILGTAAFFVTLAVLALALHQAARSRT